MSLSVDQTGLWSLLVDGGRPHARSLGVPVGGAADRAALALGNALVGNSRDELALEVTLVGPKLKALQPTACVLFGASFPVSIDGCPVEAGTTFTLEPGQVLKIGSTPSKVRGYLCVAGGFQSPPVLGSRSGFDPIAAGDQLVVRSARIEPHRLPFHASDGEPPPQKGSFEIRLLDGPQRDWFLDESFFAQVYEVNPASNRMGLRLRGAPLRRRPGELLSEAVAPGAVQITNDGLPIVLGVDGQTIGGYPKIAHVIRADLDKLAQLRPGDHLRFVRISVEEAEIAAQQRAAFLKNWLNRLQIAERQPRFVP